MNYPALWLRVPPDPSVKPTRCGMRCKPGPRHMDHHDEEFLRKAAAAKARVMQVEPAEVDWLIASGVTVIDVREPSEREKGALPSSQRMSLTRKMSSDVGRPTVSAGRRP